MEKIKLTKGELKKQRDCLRQYERYLPTLQLKKQQLQMEIMHQYSLLSSRRNAQAAEQKAIEVWIGLFPEVPEVKKWLIPTQVVTSVKNVAGVDIPLFSKVDFALADYDLFLIPLWVDVGLEALRKMVSLFQEINVIEKGIAILKQELRITTQRVNLFEKVKIPEAKEAIRLIKIYIGDQMTNAVGRSKIAKGKIEAMVLEEVAA